MPALVLFVLAPLVLALTAYFLRQRPYLQIVVIVLVGIGLAGAELAVTQGDLRPATTWTGFLVILLTPLLFGAGGVIATRQITHRRLAAVAAFAGVPLVFWIGFLVGLSTAVTLGLASP